MGGRSILGEGSGRAGRAWSTVLERTSIMRRVCLSFAALLVIAVAGFSVAAAQSSGPTNCTPSPGTSNIIVCFGYAGCPPGYLDETGRTARNGGATGIPIMASASLVRTLCVQPSPNQYYEYETPNEGSSSPAPASASPTATAAPAQAASTPSCSPPTPAPAVLVGHNDALGAFLTNAQCLTLYELSSDSATGSACTRSCTIIWLPFQPPSGAPTLPSDATGALGVITRDDGTQQVTYNGMPLYLYSGDFHPGNVNGQGLPGDTNAQGMPGIWQVVAP